MKTTNLIALSLVLLASCASAPHRQSGDSPETVLVTYHVKSGSAAAMEQAISDAWRAYRQDHLVFSQPHVVTRTTEDGDKTRFVEIFTWVNHAAPDHVPDSVNVVWKRMQTLCESRGGRPGVDIVEVELVLPRAAK